MDADLSAIKDLSVKPVDSVLSVLGICIFDERNAPGQACHVIHWDVHIPGQCRLVVRNLFARISQDLGLSAWTVS